MDAHVETCARCQSLLDQETVEIGLQGCLDARRRRQGMDRSDILPDGLLLRLHSTLRMGNEPPTLPAQPTVPGALGSSAGPINLGTMGSFRLLNELGRGGMGIVYRAWDEPLRRIVALKVLRPDQAADSDRRRLVREAQFAASFRNDHAVTIYAVVDPPDGLPYLVMEYVDGPTLALQIASDRRPGPRQVALYAAGVADALSAAHLAGLIHRDVKPSNILIERTTGRAKITDFGLARSQEAAGGLTREGIVAGTPTYMSPEQARGESQLDARTDVYSLGATLYEAMTGQPPFAGAAQAVLRRILEEDPIPARRLDDTIPRDLETICSKAMDREPARRYQAASELAADLRRWLSGEPILARPAGRMERIVRKARRHPRSSALAVALAAVVILGISGVFWQWSQAEFFRRRAERERDEAKKQQLQARLDFRRAREAVDRYLTEVSEDPELKTENLDPLRRSLLQTARDFYERFLADHPADPELASELGRAQGRLGSIVMDLESIPKGIPYYQKKLDIFARLHETNSTDRAFQHELAESHLQLGWGLIFDAKSDLAEEHLLAARGLWSDLARDRPDDTETARYLARCQGLLGMNEQYYRGRLDRAEPYYQESRRILDRLITANPDNVNYQAELASILHRQGELFGRTHRLELGIAALEEAAALQEKQLRAAPGNALARARWANHLLAIGELCESKGEFDRAQSVWLQALGQFEQVVRDHPHHTAYAVALAETHCSLGKLTALGRLSAALGQQHLDTGRALLERLLRTHSQLGELWNALWFNLQAQRTYFLARGEPRSYLKAIDERLKWHSSLKSKDLNIDGVRHRVILITARADALRWLGRPEEALNAYAEASKTQKVSIADLEPAIRRGKVLAQALLAVQKGDTIGAESLARQAVELAPQDGETLYSAAAVAARCAGASPAHKAELERHVARSVELLLRAKSNSFPTVFGPRLFLNNDPAFDGIRSHADFQELTAGLARPAVMSSRAEPVDEPVSPDGDWRSR